MANILLLLLNFDFKTNFNLLLYSLSNFSFMFISVILSISTIPRYLYPLFSISLIICPFKITKLFSFTTFPLFSTSTAHLLTPNSIPISSLKKCAVCTSESIWSWFSANNLRIWILYHPIHNKLLLSLKSMSMESYIRQTVVGIGCLPGKFPSEYAHFPSFHQPMLILASMTACYHSQKQPFADVLQNRCS